jgi:hypothetical protein
MVDNKGKEIIKKSILCTLNDEDNTLVRSSASAISNIASI